MGLRDLLSLPRKDRRARSKDKSEVDAIGEEKQVDPAVPALVEEIGSSISPTSAPSTSRGGGPNGAWAALFRMVHLTILPRTQATVPFLTESDPFSAKDKANA